MASTIADSPVMPTQAGTPEISGFNAWFAANMAGSTGMTTSTKGKRMMGGKWPGKSFEEAHQLGMAEYATLPDDQKMEWDSKAKGEHLKPGGMPFSGPSVSTGKMGKPLVSGESPTAAARTQAFAANSAANATAAKTAVSDRKAWQAANPAAVADMNIAARNENLAKSGITDMGGGTMAMQNKYGTGFAEKLTPEQFAARKPGIIRDEKGTVDMTALKDGKLAYDPATTNTPALNMDAADANRAAIQQKIAAAAPGAAARLAADRNKQIAALPAMPGNTASSTPAKPAAMPSIPTPSVAQVKQAAPAVGRAAAAMVNPVLPAAFDLAKSVMPKAKKTSTP